MFKDLSPAELRLISLDSSSNNKVHVNGGGSVNARACSGRSGDLVVAKYIVTELHFDINPVGSKFGVIHAVGKQPLNTAG